MIENLYFVRFTGINQELLIGFENSLSENFIFSSLSIIFQKKDRNYFDIMIIHSTFFL